MARKHATQEEETEINITPMLDIVFIMLIFFIVTTSFVRETGIDPSRPDAITAEQKPRGNILIAISETGKIWMEKKPVQLQDVRRLVENSARQNPESSVVIIADEKSASGTLIDLMDQIRAGGVTNIAVAAEIDGGPG